MTAVSVVRPVRALLFVCTSRRFEPFATIAFWVFSVFGVCVFLSSVFESLRVSNSAIAPRVFHSILCYLCALALFVFLVLPFFWFYT